MQGVYRIRNKINDKRYIGSAQDFDERWDIHRKELQKGNHYNKYLQRAWNKYGGENFVFEVEEEVKGSRRDAFDREQDYLDKWMPTGLLYNISFGANGGATQGTGWHPTEETCAKLSKAKSGKNNPRGMLGKRHTKETKVEISKKLSGKNNPMYGTSRSGEDNPFYGKSHTEETCTKIGKANAKSYPAYYNVKTEEFIPAGQNLTKLCRVQDLNYMAMWNLKYDNIKQSRGGWRVIK